MQRALEDQFTGTVTRIFPSTLPIDDLISKLIGTSLSSEQIDVDKDDLIRTT